MVKLADISRVVSPNAPRAKRWSAQEDFILRMLVGTESYAQIAMRLGRTPASVQSRASDKGYSQRAEWAQGRETHKSLSEARRTEILKTPAEDLEEFCQIPDENPVLPHPGDRTYHREYARTRRQEKAHG